jgi:proteasome lid subunit RPN8/RPN11
MTATLIPEMNPLRTAAEAVLAHARSSSEEVVGIIWSDGTTTPLTNQARSPQRFSVSETAVREAILEGADSGKEFVYGVYHSHPSGRLDPSKADIELMSEMDENLWFTGALFVIASNLGMSVWAWNDGPVDVTTKVL